MRVAVIPADMTGCGTYRMILPANAVMKARPDWQIDLYQPSTVKLGSSQNGKITAVKGMNNPKEYDLLVMQRIGTDLGLQFFKWAQANGIATIMDSDDAMWQIDKDNVAYRLWNSATMHWRFLDGASELADLTTVTTKHLANRYGKHGRTEVIPNYVPEQVFDYPRHESERPVSVGWAGFVGTHPQDLQVMGDAMQRAVADGAVPRIIGDAKGGARVWGLKEIEEVPPQMLGQPYFTALSLIDIAVVPLTDSGFNRGKSWLKALEFSAMGVPVIATPTPANKELAQSLPILLADSPDEWYEQIKYLMESPNDRKMIGEKARQAVRDGFTIEGHGETWAQSWERAVIRRKALTA